MIQINRNIPCTLGLEELILFSWTQYPKPFTDLTQILLNSHADFYRTKMNSAKIYVEPQRPLIVKAVLKGRKETSWRYNLPSF